jgi:hypothetical protein
LSAIDSVLGHSYANGGLSTGAYKSVKEAINCIYEVLTAVSRHYNTKANKQRTENITVQY